MTQKKNLEMGPFEEIDLYRCTIKNERYRKAKS